MTTSNCISITTSEELRLGKEGAPPPFALLAEILVSTPTIRVHSLSLSLSLAPLALKDSEVYADSVSSTSVRVTVSIDTFTDDFNNYRFQVS